jgi:epoxyqueuosine reductase
MEGCMLCQLFCPENKEFWSWIEERAEFSEEETALLLQGAPKGQLSREMIQKLDRLDFLGDLELFPRNLGVFLEK